MHAFAATGILIISTALGAVLSSVSGCGSNRIQRCGVLPDPEACPIERGGTCEDPACTALYGCYDGEWRLEETCSQAGSGGAGAQGASPAAGGCNGVQIDRTGEAVGCSPPLQEPDCPAAAAELCRPCETVCVDFYLCRAEGWEAVAFCDENRNVVVEP